MDHGDTEEAWRLAGPLRSFHPDAVALLERAGSDAWRSVDPVLLEMARLSAARLIGSAAARGRRSEKARAGGLGEDKISALGDFHRSDHFDRRERVVLDFVEQFVVDVSGVTEQQRLDLRSVLDEGTERFVVALYVMEFSQRLELMSARVLSPAGAAPVPESGGPGAAPVPESGGPESGGPESGGPESGGPTSLAADESSPPQLRRVLAAYQEAVVRATALDPIVTELVRLRCARTHNCRICQTLRLAEAAAAGVDAEMTEKVDFYEKSDLDERVKVALRVTDAFVTRPDTLGEAAAGQARQIFSQVELAELCLDITKWSTQKINVALGTDGTERLTVNEEGVSYFSFADDGRVARFSSDADTLVDSSPLA